MDGNIGTWGEEEIEKQIAESRTHQPDVDAKDSKNDSSLNKGNGMILFVIYQKLSVWNFMDHS